MENCPNCTKLKAELEKLKEYKRLHEGESEAHFCCVSENADLQQENAKLKEEVETVRLESYGEALKNKRLRELLSEEKNKKFCECKKDKDSYLISILSCSKCRKPYFKDDKSKQ